MCNMNTDTWKWFFFDDLFFIKGSKTTPKLSLEEYGRGVYPYVTTQAVNNGIEDYYDFYTENGNVFTVDSAVAGFCAYQEKNFSASDHVEILVPLFDCNKYIALFLTTLINKEQYRYNYGRKCNQRNLKNSKLKLPVTSLGKIDWQWIEDYIKYSIIPKLPPKANSVWNNAYDRLPFFEKKKSLQSKKWKRFLIKDFFDVTRGKRIVRNIDYFTDKNDEFCYSVITASVKNNSVDGFYHSYNCPENSIVCGGEASGSFSTYQADKCWVMDRARIFTPKANIIINKFIALFLCVIFDKNQYRYSYGRSANPDNIQNTAILLPVNHNDYPDWQFMEDYIKSLPYANEI